MIGLSAVPFATIVPSRVTTSAPGTPTVEPANAAAVLWLGPTRDSFRGVRLPIDLTPIGAGGCTLLVDLATGRVRYAIRKDIRSENRMQQQRDFLFGGTETTLGATYFRAFARRAEPFALLHRHL